MSTFILGLGAQKSGTTWLFKNLSSQPYSDFGFAKEYHVFDYILADKVDMHYDVTLTNEQRDTIVAFRKNTNEYFDYFQNILSQDNIKLTGDITPTYTALSTDMFLLIKNEFAKRNIVVKPILIMRDPVYRLHSMAYQRMRGPFNTKADMLSVMHELHLSNHDLYRSCYDTAMENVCKVFGKENVFYTLYEDLFDNKTINNLSKFVGIKFINTFNLNDKVNASTDKFSITEDEYLFFKSRYIKLYEYCKNELGLPVDERWTYIQTTN